MEKRGLIGKIMIIMAIAILIILAIIGITIYQVYDLMNTVQEKTPVIKSQMEELAKGDCTKITSIESEVNDLKTKVNSACSNPLIRTAARKMDQLQFKCEDIPKLESMIQGNLSLVKNYCNNISSSMLK